MKFSTALLYDLARGVPTHELLPSDTSVEVPPLISPVSVLAEAQGPRRVQDSTTIQRTSFRITVAATQPVSSTPTTVTIVTVGRGNWHFAWSLGFAGIGTQSAGFATDQMTLGLTDLIDRVVLAAAFSVTGQLAQLVGERKFLIPEDSWFFSISFPSTGAAEQLEVSGGIVGSKLL